jgi:hypothetical protein
MKLVSSLILFVTLNAQASPLISVKDRLRIHMWFHGLDQEKPLKPMKEKTKQLPEEIERALRKI